MNYEDMSDFEINKLVATNLGYKLREKFKWEESQCWVKVGMEKLPSKIFDFTGSPSDAWPIILENNIGVTPATVRSNRNKDLWIASPDWTFETPFDTNHKNPLRAAMICFLKMKDAENDR